MTAKQFFIDGQGSGTIGVYITSQNAHNAPQIDFDVVEVPGRNGNLVKWNNRFSNIELTFACYCNEFSAIEELKKWLYSVKDYRRIESDYEPEYYREGYFPNQFDISPFYDGAHFQFNLTFNCKPQRWLKVSEDIEFLTGYTPQSITFDFYSRNEWMIAELLNMVQSQQRPNDDVFMVYDLNAICDEYTVNMMVVNIPNGMNDKIFCGFIVQDENGFIDTDGTTWIRGNNELRCGTNTSTYSEHNNYFLVIQPNANVGSLTLDVYDEGGPGVEPGIVETFSNLFVETGSPVTVENEYIGTTKPSFEIKFTNSASESYYYYATIAFAVDGEFVKIDFSEIDLLLRTTVNVQLYELTSFDVIFDAETLNFAFQSGNINLSINSCCEIIGDIKFESGSNEISLFENANSEPKPTGFVVSPRWWTL